MENDAFGIATAPASGSNHCLSGSTVSDLLYKNQRIDASTGNYQFGERAYAPSKDAFLQPDRFLQGGVDRAQWLQTNPGTANLFGYAAGDPVNKWDPSGHYCAGVMHGFDGCGESSPGPGPNGQPAAGQRPSFDPAPSNYHPRDPSGGAHPPSAAPPSVAPASLASLPIAANDLSTRSYPNLGGLDLAHTCVLDPNCTVADFNAMGADDRYAFMSEFQSIYKTRDSFNNVQGVIKAFGDHHLISSGNWWSEVDAATLEAISTGRALSQGMTPRQTITGSSEWSTFFTTLYKPGASDSDLHAAWGHAELATIHGGNATATAAGILPPKGAETFVQYGDTYRQAEWTNNTTALRDATAWLAFPNDAYNRGAYRSMEATASLAPGGVIGSDAWLLRINDESYTHNGTNWALDQIFQGGWG